MSIQTDTVLKSYFETGDQPTQTQFASLIDSKISQYARGADVKIYGAVGDGVTDDTTALQAALNSGQSVIIFTPGEYIISAVLTVPTTVTHILGMGAKISTSGTGYQMMSVSARTSAFHLQDIDFYAAPGRTDLSTNKLLTILEGPKALVSGCTFDGGGNIAVLFDNVDFPIFTLNEIKNSQRGVYAYSALGGQFTHNYIHSGTLPTTTLEILMAFQHRYTPAEAQNDSIVIANNICVGRNGFGQGIMAHGNKRFVITGNIVKDTSIGISLNIFSGAAATETNEQSIISNNTINGLSAGIGLTTGDSGIIVSGDPSVGYGGVIVTGNTITNGNTISLKTGCGGIWVTGVPNVIIVNNIVRNWASAGIYLYTGTTGDIVNIQVRNNLIDTIAGSGAIDSGILCEGDWGKQISGVIKDNIIKNAEDFIIRLARYYPELYIYDTDSLPLNTTTFSAVNGSGVINGERTWNRTMAFTSGGPTEILPGMQITGATSGAIGVIHRAVVASGAWATENAAGTLQLVATSGVFGAENVNITAPTSLATADACTVAGPSVPNPVPYVKQTAVMLLAGTQSTNITNLDRDTVQTFNINPEIILRPLVNTTIVAYGLGGNFVTLNGANISSGTNVSVGFRWQSPRWVETRRNIIP